MFAPYVWAIEFGATKAERQRMERCGPRPVTVWNGGSAMFEEGWRAAGGGRFRQELAGQLDDIDRMPTVAGGETVILLHFPLPSAGVSVGMWRGRQQNDSLADSRRPARRSRCSRT